MGNERLLGSFKGSKKLIPQKKKQSKIFNDADYNMTKTSSKSMLSELDKLYVGHESKLNNTKPKEMYFTPIRRETKNREKQNIFSTDNDYEEEIIFGEHAFSEFASEAKAMVDFAVKKVANEQDDTKKDSGEKEGGILAMAEDFCIQEKLLLVGDEIYIYNGVFYERLSEKEKKRRIFKRYRKEISRTNPSHTINSVAEILKYCIDKSLDEFPENSNLIVFLNGTLEVSTGHFRANSKKDFANSALGIK